MTTATTVLPRPADSEPTDVRRYTPLARAGLIEGTRIRQWVFYRRVENRIDEVKRMIGEGL